MALPASFDRTQFGVLGTLVGTIAAGLLVAGMGGLLVHFIQEPDGMDASAPIGLATTGQAVVVTDLGMGASLGDWIPEGTAQSYAITVEPHDGAVFVGIAAATDIDRYLHEAARTSFHKADDDGRLWQDFDGPQTAAAPTDQNFWAATAQGSDEQTIRWEGRPGDWDLVIMNPSGATQVDVTAHAGVLLTSARPFGLRLLAVGIGFGMVATALWLLGSTDETRRYWLGKIHLQRGRDPDAV